MRPEKQALSEALPLVDHSRVFLDGSSLRFGMEGMELDLGAIAKGYIADQKTVEDEIEARELARIIGEFLDTLTLENRVIFMRRYWFADSYKDIAEFMGLSEKNISVRLTRIREKMKQYLIEREVFV